MQKKGRIIKSTGSWYLVKSDDLSVISCRLPGKFRLSDFGQTNPIAVGDHVSFRMHDDGTGSIDRIEERINMITRKATHGKKGQQVLASNIDLAVCVQSVKQPVYKTGFIDRFIITSEANQVTPLILLNKYDLASENQKASLESLGSLYTDLGYTMLVCSIYDVKSMQAFREIIGTKTILLMGPSGTGKTSILNHLAPGLNKSTEEVSGFSNKGKHTTTFAELIDLPGGGFVVDTPGIREFGLVDIDKSDLSNFFPEMRFLREKCRYYNCTHIHEPGCMVIEAYEKGTISASRYLSYIQILESL